MMTYARSLTVIAALFGALGVMLGAFAAHGANNPQAASWLQTGGSYLLVHGIAALAAVRLAQNRVGRVAATLFLLGSAIFAGTLTALSCDGPRWLGAVTPVGGLMIIAGWFALAWALAYQKSVGTE